MRNSWTRLARTGLVVLGTLAALSLIAHLHGAATRGWPGGFGPHLAATLAAWLEGLAWYLPAAALAAGASARPLRPTGISAAAAAAAAAVFALRGFIGPWLGHRTRMALLGPEQRAEVDAVLRPNDWLHLRDLAAQPGIEAWQRLALLAEIHGTVALALMAALMLPLGVALGRGARRPVLAAAATAITLAYGAQIGTWRLVLGDGVPPAPMMYIGFLTVPVVMLLTLAWSAATRPTPDPGPAA